MILRGADQLGLMIPPQSIPAKICRRLLRWAEAIEEGRVSRYRRYVDCYETVRALRLMESGTLETIYDIGASRGHWAETVCAFFPGVKDLVLFEPSKDCSWDLRALPLGGTRIHLEEIALGRTPGSAALHGRGPSASLLAPTMLQERFFPGQVTPGREQVAVDTLDGVVGSRGYPPADLIKLDVQGFEDSVLAGGRTTLAAARWLVLELSVLELYEGQKTAGMLLSTLEADGWRIAGIGYQWRSAGGSLVQFDAILNRDTRK